jgi:hypothetical protein
MKIISVLVIALSILAMPYSANATVKPSTDELVSYSSLVVSATIKSIKKPYVNQSIVTLSVSNVLHGHQEEFPIILDLLDNSMIVKGSLDVGAIMRTGKEHVYYLNYKNGGYHLSDSVFGVELMTVEALGYFNK